MRDVLLLARCTSTFSIPFYFFQLRDDIFSIVLKSCIHYSLSTLSTRVFSSDTKSLTCLVTSSGSYLLSLCTSGSLCGSLTWVLPRSCLRLKFIGIISLVLLVSCQLSRVISSVFLTPGIKLLWTYVKFIRRRLIIIIIRS